MAPRCEEWGYTPEELDALKEQIAITLRVHGALHGVSDKVVRLTFTNMFGAEATAAEFGPEPTGAGVREAIQPYLVY
jgi:hypothetical protein